MATATEEKVVEKNLLEAESRTAGNKNEARRVRRGGKIPAVLYGAGKDALALDGNRTKAMIVDWQYEPIKGALLHIDLKRIAMDQKLKVNVPIVLKGEAAGVKQQGGILEQILREVEIECLPTDIPSHIEADVSELVFGKVLRVADLPHSEKFKFLTDENQTVAHVITVKEEVAPAPEAVAAEAGAVPAEPEVIKKGKQETEEEGAEEAVAEKAPKPEKGE